MCFSARGDWWRGPSGRPWRWWSLRLHPKHFIFLNKPTNMGLMLQSEHHLFFFICSFIITFLSLSCNFCVPFFSAFQFVGPDAFNIFQLSRFINNTLFFHILISCRLEMSFCLGTYFSTEEDLRHPHECISLDRNFTFPLGVRKWKRSVLSFEVLAIASFGLAGVISLESVVSLFLELCSTTFPAMAFVHLGTSGRVGVEQLIIIHH